MSHASVLVVLPGEIREPQEAVQYEMEPFDEEGGWFRDGSRWDWWVIGGRFTGCLDLYDPQMDKRNWESCDLCDGTGTRRDLDKVVEGWCNGCSQFLKKGLAVGVRIKWPTEWVPHNGDVMTMGELRKIKRDSPFRTYAVLKERNWHERSRLGWFGDETKTEHDRANGDEEKPPETQRFRLDSSHEAIITTYNEPDEHWEARFGKRFLDPLPDSVRVAMVDYHV